MRGSTVRCSRSASGSRRGTGRCTASSRRRRPGRSRRIARRWRLSTKTGLSRRRVSLFRIGMLTMRIVNKPNTIMTPPPMMVMTWRASKNKSPRAVLAKPRNPMMNVPKPATKNRLCTTAVVRRLAAAAAQLGRRLVCHRLVRPILNDSPETGLSCCACFFLDLLRGLPQRFLVALQVAPAQRQREQVQADAAEEDGIAGETGR